MAHSITFNHVIDTAFFLDFFLIGHTQILLCSVSHFQIGNDRSSHMSVYSSHTVQAILVHDLGGTEGL